MLWFQQIKRKFKNLFEANRTIEPSDAYDLWASTYDKQTDNPVVYLDDILWDEMLSNVAIEDKIIVDVGCGTGRHWEKILKRKPLRLIGYDISSGMLSKLREKYPFAETHISAGNRLEELANQSSDLIVSALTLGYMENLPDTFREWNRVLKRNGEVVITDFHPQPLKEGAKRSFTYKGRSLVIKNYVHSLRRISSLAKEMNWKEIAFAEKKVDGTIKHFFEKSNSLNVYNKSINSPLLYGYHFVKQ